MAGNSVEVALWGFSYIFFKDTVYAGNKDSATNMEMLNSSPQQKNLNDVRWAAVFVFFVFALILDCAEGLSQSLPGEIILEQGTDVYWVTPGRDDNLVITGIIQNRGFEPIFIERSSPLAPTVFRMVDGKWEAVQIPRAGRSGSTTAIVRRGIAPGGESRLTLPIGRLMREGVPVEGTYRFSVTVLSGGEREYRRTIHSREIRVYLE